MSPFLSSLTVERMKAVYEDISSAAQANYYYYMMVGLAATVATLGLLTNSAAVIIGAMLISPLMSPIIGGALGITLGDTQLLKRSVYAEVAGVVLAIILSTFLTLLSPTRELTSEILARTEPTLFDLLVALASGIAGAYTITYRPDSSALPGVAISTALMPPLCVAGVGLATYQHGVAMGGFLLFLANWIAINLAGFIVFRIAGFTSHYGQSEKIAMTDRQRLLISVALLVLISIPLVSIMLRVVERNETNKQIRDSLVEYLQIIPRSELVSYNFESGEQAMKVNGVVRTASQYTPSQVREMENILEYKLKKPVELQLQMIRVDEVNRLALSSFEVNKSATPGQGASKGEELPAEALPVFALEQSNAVRPENALNNPEKLIEDILLEKSKVSPEFNWQTFSFTYDREKSSYEVTIKMKPQAAVPQSMQDLLVQLMENRLRRKVVLKIEQTLQLDSRPGKVGPAMELEEKN